MKVETIDMKEADNYVFTELDLIKKALKKSRVYRKDLLYRGFNGNNIPRLLKEGQDTPSKYLYCNDEKEITELPYVNEQNVFGYASEYTNPAIAIFNSKLLAERIPYGYLFKNPNKKLEALVAVYKLKNLIHPKN